MTHGPADPLPVMPRAVSVRDETLPQYDNRPPCVGGPWFQSHRWEEIPAVFRPAAEKRALGSPRSPRLAAYCLVTVSFARYSDGSVGFDACGAGVSETRAIV